MRQGVDAESPGPGFGRRVGHQMAEKIFRCSLRVSGPASRREARSTLAAQLKPGDRAASKPDAVLSVTLLCFI